MNDKSVILPCPFIFYFPLKPIFPIPLYFIAQWNAFKLFRKCKHLATQHDTIPSRRLRKAWLCIAAFFPVPETISRAIDTVAIVLRFHLDPFTPRLARNHVKSQRVLKWSSKLLKRAFGEPLRQRAGFLPRNRSGRSGAPAQLVALTFGCCVVTIGCNCEGFGG